jgi:hypothetical protein
MFCPISVKKSRIHLSGQGLTFTQFGRCILPFLLLLFGAMLTENIMHLNMIGDETGNDEEKLDTTDSTDRSLITDISDSLSYLSSENRKTRQRERLRKELVREHIENQEMESSLLQSLVNKLTKTI